LPFMLTKSPGSRTGSTERHLNRGGLAGLRIQKLRLDGVLVATSEFSRGQDPSGPQPPSPVCILAVRSLGGPPGGPFWFLGMYSQRRRCRLLVGDKLKFFCSIGALPVLTLTRPISTMHTAKTQSVRQPQRNRFLLRPIAHHRHYGRGRMDRSGRPEGDNDIVEQYKNPVRPFHGHPDDKPHPWFTNDFGLPRMGCGTKRPLKQGTVTSADLVHLETSTPLPSTSAYHALFEVNQLLGKTRSGLLAIDRGDARSAISRGIARR